MCAQTTVVLWLCGADLCEADVNGAHFYPCSLKEEKFKSLTVTASTLSETKQINAISHTLEDDQKVVVCDSPGAFDNRMSEIDVANGVGTANAMRKCKSLRFAIVISKGDFGNTMLSFQKFGLMMTKMFQPLDKYLGSFQYLFTKFDQSEANKVHEKVKAFRREHEAQLRAEPQLIALLDDIINKTANGAFIMDPRNKEAAKDFLKTLINLSKITEPEDVIHNFVLDDSYLVVTNQIDIHHRSIQKLFNSANFELAAFKLTELQRMSSLLQVGSISKKVTRATGAFCDSLCDLENAYITNRKDLLAGSLPSASDLIRSALDLLGLGDVYPSYRRNECRDICNREAEERSGYAEMVEQMIPFKGKDILDVMEELEHRFLTGLKAQWYHILGNARWSRQCGDRMVTSQASR